MAVSPGFLSFLHLLVVAACLPATAAAPAHCSISLLGDPTTMALPTEPMPGAACGCSQDSFVAGDDSVLFPFLNPGLSVLCSPSGFPGQA
jgi:hypothetical protein